MKKNLKLAACMMAAALVLAACDDDEPVVSYETVGVADGVFILNEGSYYNQISGSLDYLDYATGTLRRNVFRAANGRALGGTPNNAITCGSKMYIATQEENRVEVVDLATLKALEPISVTAPRELCTDGEAVYVSSYTGCVSKIDTLALRVTATSEVVGANLEGIAWRNGYVYVCNAWNTDYTYNANLAKLDSRTLQKQKDIAVAANPNQLIASGDDLYLAAWGNYGVLPATIQHIDADDAVTTLGHAVYMALSGNKLYLVGSSYDSNWNEMNTYTVLDLTTRTESTFTEGKEIVSPAAIGVDPLSGDVFITSRSADPNRGTPSFTLDGYILQYRADGTLVARYDCGVSPATLIFVSHEEQRKK